MGIRNFIILLFLSVVRAQNACRNSYCDKNGPFVQFPFWIQGQQRENCGLPGFNLSCNAQKRPVLNIPNSGEFHVSSINGYMKRVILNDPDNCIPMRLLSLNLSSSPFMAVFYQNFTFFSCPKAQVNSSKVLSCLSNKTSDILATTYEDDFELLSMCKEIERLEVPVSSFYWYGFPVDLELTWYIPTCEGCGSVLRITILSLVMLAVIIPALIIGISCCICMMRGGNPQASEPVRTSGRSGSTDTVTAGLDKSTIETYKKITITDSCQNEEPRDATCTICLEDYVPMETIMFMPECGHCFHEECIDKWLSRNSKCPICRTLQTATNSC